MKTLVAQLPLHILKSEKVLVIVLAGLLGLSSILYAYFVNQTVLNIVERKDLETELSELSAHVAQMEFSYMSRKNDITKEYAYNQGYREVANKQFVTRTNTTLTLRE